MNTFLKFWPNWPHLAQKRPIFDPSFQVEIFSAHISTNWSLWAMIHPNCLLWWSGPSNLTHAISEMLFLAQKRGLPPKMAKKCPLFPHFSPFYVLFGSVWPSKRVQHQFFVSWNLYLGHKKSWGDYQVKKGGAHASKYLKFALFCLFYTVLGSFRPSNWAFYLLSGHL